MLNKEKGCQIYKFDYGNAFKFFLSYLIQFLVNLQICIFIYLGYFMLLGIITHNISNSGLRMFFAAILTMLSAITIAFFMVISVLPKRAILTTAGIKVRRNSIPTFDLVRGFNDYIAYSTIVSCDIYIGNIRAGKNLPVIFFNWDSLVEIKDIRNRRYFIPVKSAEIFISEVNKRIDKLG